jgi:hypothetical protein
VSEPDKEPKDVLWLLGAVCHRVHHEVAGGHGHRSRTGLARVLVLLVSLPLAGPVLWGAIPAMPPALVVFIGSAVVFRVGRWYWRRYYRP